MRKEFVNAATVLASLIAYLAGAECTVRAQNMVRPVYAPVGDVTSVPAGYLQFCRDNPADCADRAEEARDVVLSKTAWRDLKTVNDRVNAAIEPMTDQDNYGKTEYWAYPTNGRGDCEDYVLLKRKLLIDAGWPRSALLITVVRDKKGDGHAVLMVKTDRGEFVLDNQEARILPWQATGYRYVKRQAQQDQNLWVSLGDTQTTSVVASGGD
jgi:predicted transglutaminase-like cysteine proteinase